MQKVDKKIKAFLMKTSRIDPKEYGYKNQNWTIDLMIHHIKKRYSVNISRTTLKKKLNDLCVFCRSGR